MAPAEPSRGSLKMALAPNAATMRLRSVLTLPGMTSSTGKPSAAPIMASAIPVLPDVESMIVLPVTSLPFARPTSIIFRAGRSFTEPPGLKPSSFAKRRTSGGTPSRTCSSSTSGVLPISCRTEGATGGEPPLASIAAECGAAAVPVMGRSRTARDRRHDRQLVAGLHRRPELLQKANVLTVHEDVDEPPHLPGIVADAIFQPRVLLVELIEDRKSVV